MNEKRKQVSSLEPEVCAEKKVSFRETNHTTNTTTSPKKCSQKRFAQPFKVCATLSCPPLLLRVLRRLYTICGFWTTFVLFFGLIFTSSYSISTTAAFPPKCRQVLSNPSIINCQNGQGLSVLFLYILAFAAGELTEVIRLPGLLGMLLAGLLIRLTGTLITDYKIDYSSMNVTDLGEEVNTFVVRLAAMCQVESHLSALLRRLALATILTRAGFSLDPRALKEGCSAVFRLAFMPCLFEAMGATIGSVLIIHWPWSWGALLGFVLAAVSPAVIVPNMLRLEIDGWGKNKGIPTLVMAASSMDDVIAIIGFGVALSICFTGGKSITETVFWGIFEAICGAFFGVIAGIVLWALPPPGLEHCHMLRIMLTVFLSITFLVGSEQVHMSGAGALACLCFAFTVAAGWRLGYPWRIVTVEEKGSPTPNGGHEDMSTNCVVAKDTVLRDEEDPQQPQKDAVKKTPSNGFRPLRLAYSVLPPHMQSDKRLANINNANGPFGIRKYFPITPRTRRFSLPEPRAHYDSEDFMKKSTLKESWKNRRLRLGSQQYALQSMRSPINVMNSVVGIDTKDGPSRFRQESQDSVRSVHGAIPEADYSSEISEDGSSTIKQQISDAVDPSVKADNELEVVHEVSHEEEEDLDVPEEEYLFEVTPHDRGVECIKSIQIVYAVLWWFVQPLLFVLIGSEVNIYELFDKNIGSSIFVLAISLTVRLCATVLAVTPSKLLLRERIFVSVAWLPKATVQAAIGSTAYDHARAMSSDEPNREQYMQWGETVLSLAVISILITAPLGAFLIPLTAPKLLKQTARSIHVDGTSVAQEAKKRNMTRNASSSVLDAH